MPVTTVATRGATMKPLVRDALLSFMTQRKIGSQSEFAKAIKLSTGYVCDVLALRRNLSPEIIDRMTTAFGLTRRQIADFNHRAAQVAGWKLPPLPDDQKVPLVEPATNLMRPRREYALAAQAAGRPLRVKRQPVQVKPAKAKAKAKPKNIARHEQRTKAKKKASDERHPSVTVRASAAQAEATRALGGFEPPTPEELANDVERGMT